MVVVERTYGNLKLWFKKLFCLDFLARWCYSRYIIVDLSGWRNHIRFCIWLELRALLDYYSSIEARGPSYYTPPLICI